MTTTLSAKHIHITGIVQGVGFRPFVYGLAMRYALYGWVCNTSAGVDIEVDGPCEVLDRFVAALTAEAPPLAHIDTIEVGEIAGNGFTSFEIRHSVARPDDFLPISPDITLCDDCRRELFDPADRRYQYPFINCTNCGPRFTIIKDIPYDRPLTTMADFSLCEDCAKEYADPLNRRFHAQPVACPQCGPEVWLATGGERRAASGDEAISEVRRLLVAGRIIAIKGLGGFHLACDATNDAAVAELRRRKGRIDKPFALMAPNVAAVEQFCEVTPEERTLLESKEHPIVLLKKKSPDASLRRAHPERRETKSKDATMQSLPGSNEVASHEALATTNVSDHVAPGQSTLGVMLPYTPLHELLFTSGQRPAASCHPLVMTSGNFSEEPIVTDNDDALSRLAPLADAFLLHNRDIHVRCDDAVVRVFESKELPIRRSRGYAPYPVKLPFNVPTILAAGAELKNTFCVTRDDYAFLSHHIGDLENYETLKSFEEGILHFERLFRIKPELMAYDLHPNYLATRYALERAERDGLKAIGVQHHHAHIAACLAENNWNGDCRVIGVAFDGTGYGTDGAIWGGEFLIADYHGFERVAHLDYMPLPGGDAATKHPYRIALSYLQQAGVAWADDLAPVQVASAIERAAICKQIESGINTFPTSSLGRLFDAVASICGVRQAVNYEGQAAIEFEALADGAEQGDYTFETDETPGCIKIAGVIRAVVADARSGVATALISARFHNGLAQLVLERCETIRRERRLNEVALSGGVWQNVTLLRKTLDRLRAENFTVYVHHLVPPNDGGLALGQARIAAAGIGHG
ncbi:Carbamoyltransferase HypF [Thermoflexales bacterium]|nr:Carbamoyltransferase HypF [Thermoflexales bacterium]